ncbi:MAG: single-stranded-DNA-specific exonuclease RecJ [Alphaproteobacteria bacterium]|nr:MAG: single-stranded-DNA-specific exonuclease RecJ [Alphaproteobacteria bacterium]
MSVTTKAFLGVENSLSGRRWVGPTEHEERLAEAIAREAGLPRPVALVLARRGVPPEEARPFLEPQLRTLLPDPSVLRDMDLAAERFVTALDRNERIAIFADYDVDGGASAALLLTWLRQMGRKATLYVPDRIDEGYGPNTPAMVALAREHDLVLTVDCGTLSHEPIAAATAEGADVIVLDHHLGAETLPPALAVVNPNRQDEDGSLGHLAAAGVVFLFLVAVNRILRARGAEGPELLSFLDLVALATVADVAPLVGVNRALVRQGLRVMARRQRPGLVALSDVAGMDTAPTSHHLGFLLGPRINAGGRIGRADLGARLLATSDPAEAEAIARELETLNAERRAVEARVLEEARAQAERRGADGPLVWAAGADWHPGVVGIVASRLKEWANRPAVVLGVNGATGTGSGRSVGGVDLGAAVQRLVAEGHALKGGGHRMAAGLTVAKERIEDAMARLAELVARQGAGAGGPQELRVDGPLMASAVDVELVETLETAGPFGQAAPSPRFVLPAHRIASVREVGTGHLKLALDDGAGHRIDAICFRAGERGLDALGAMNGCSVHVAGRPELNAWGGRLKPQLRVEDAAPASEKIFGSR